MTVLPDCAESHCHVVGQESAESEGNLLPLHDGIPGEAGGQVEGHGQPKDSRVAKSGSRQGAGDEVGSKAHEGGCAVSQCQQLAGILWRHILYMKTSVIAFAFWVAHKTHCLEQTPLSVHIHHLPRGLHQGMSID